MPIVRANKLLTMNVKYIYKVYKTYTNFSISIHITEHAYFIILISNRADFAVHGPYSFVAL